MVLDDVTRSNGHRLQLGKFKSDIRKKVHLKVGAALEQVPREVVETLSSEVFNTLLKSWLKTSPPGNSPTSHGRLDKRSPEFPPNHHFCFLTLHLYNSAGMYALKRVICTSYFFRL